MMTSMPIPIFAACFAAFTLTQGFAQIITTTDTFGSGANTFTIDFVNIGNPGNAADATGYGAVAYEYRVGKFEVSLDQVNRAEASGLSNVNAWDGTEAPGSPAWTLSQPGAFPVWYHAAAFVNWLNTSKGYQAAYNLSVGGGDQFSMALWTSAEAWQLGGTNLYRHKNAFYFLPSENEWYKAAYYNPAESNYYIYPTGSDSAPTAVASGTEAGTAVFDQPFNPGPAEVTAAGGLSPYETMAQGGNLGEWMETAFDGSNDSPTESRVTRGGFWAVGAPDGGDSLGSTFRYGSGTLVTGPVGFRVASVPEPSTYALLLMTGAGALWLARRRR